MWTAASFIIEGRMRPYGCRLCTVAIDAEIAGHAHKLDMKLQSLCGSGFSLFAVRMLAKPYHLGVNWPTTHCKIKDGVHFFTLNFECHNRYNKLLLCDSESGDIVWWNKNNSEWGFSVFFAKQTKSLLLFKKTKKWGFLKKTKKTGGFFFQKTWVFLNPVPHPIVSKGNVEVKSENCMIASN